MADQRFDNLTLQARRVMQMAAEEARAFNHPFIGPEHLLLGLLHEQNGVAARALTILGVELHQARATIERFTGVGRSMVPADSMLTALAQQILTGAGAIASTFNQAEINTEHLLLGMLRVERGLSTIVLDACGITPDQLQVQVLRMVRHRPSYAMPQPDTHSDVQAGLLAQVSTDLTQAALAQRLDPVVGRHEEIERVIQILSRRTKNNAALIGEPGVGKTAIVEGLAQRIITGDVPETIRDKQVLALDLSALVASTKYRGQFEERLKRVVDEIKARRCIIFIDELHTIIGAGSTEGSLDAANILKPALSRGEFQVIGATTFSEYQKYITHDAALERRFQPVQVDQPSEADTVEILRGIRSCYERFHHLTISDQALQAAVSLSSRYLTDRFLPDKAIDVIDEAAVRVRMLQPAAPPMLRLAWRALDAVAAERQAAVSAREPELVDYLDQRDQRLRTWILELERTAGLAAGTTSGDGPCVTPEDVADVVSRWTRVPVRQLHADEQARLLTMEQALRARVVGQQEAIRSICRAVQRARTGLNDPGRPLGSFLFLGPSGVGKTELAKVLTEFLFGSEDHLIKIDMSEFQERHTIARLIGAPPGYVGYGEGGQLTEAVRRKPYAVILLDEIEKAHPDALNLLLQVMEDGHLTDGQSRRVNLRNTILIMTSNIGTEQIRRMPQLGFLGVGRDDGQGHDLQTQLTDALQQVFRPEFLNRLDATVIFSLLTTDEVRQIAALMLTRTEQKLSTHDIRLDVREDAYRVLVQRGYDLLLGARPLRRVIMTLIEDVLAQGMLEGHFISGDTVVVDSVLGENGMTVRLRSAREIERDDAGSGTPDTATVTDPASSASSEIRA